MLFSGKIDGGLHTCKPGKSMFCIVNNKDILMVLSKKMV